MSDSVAIPTAWFAVLEAFERRGVQYLISGSTADAIVERTPDTTATLVVSPSPFRRNLERLAKALEDLGAHQRAGGSPLDPARIVNHPALRWRLQVGETALDVIGSAVGDGEFSIRVWRTRPVTLTAGGRSISCEVEFTAEFASVS